MGWLDTVRRLIESRQENVAEGLACPRCNTSLTRTDTGDYGRVVLDVCGQCNGLWLDAGELDQLDGSVWVDLEDRVLHETTTQQAAGNCSTCQVPLKPVSASDLPEVVIEMCPACRGFWLEPGEIEQLQQLAQQLESQSRGGAGSQKPSGWSDLRWRMHQLGVSRD